MGRSGPVRNLCPNLIAPRHSYNKGTAAGIVAVDYFGW